MSKNLKSTTTVYYVTADYLPDNNAGSVRAQAIVKGLCKYVDVQVISNKKAEAYGVELIKRLPVENPQNNKHLILRTFREMIFSIGVFLRLWFVSKNAIIVVTSPPFLLLLVYVLLPRRSEVLRVLDVRDIYPDVFVEAGLISNRSLLCRFLFAIEAGEKN